VFSGDNVETYLNFGGSVQDNRLAGGGYVLVKNSRIARGRQNSRGYFPEGGQ
jgi:hypothetical protein